MDEILAEDDGVGEGFLLLLLMLRCIFRLVKNKFLFLTVAIDPGQESGLAL